jgi:hypothetical protein
VPRRGALHNDHHSTRAGVGRRGARPTRILLVCSTNNDERGSETMAATNQKGALESQTPNNQRNWSTCEASTSSRTSASISTPWW